MTVRDNKRKRRQLAHSGVWHRGNFEPNEVGDFAVADKVKLDGVEAGATADQTGAEIKVLYEGEADTNAFTDAEQTKLAGIETGATADQTAAEILTAVKTVDGAGSGLDADLLDGLNSTDLVQTAGPQTITGKKTFNAEIDVSPTMYISNATYGGIAGAVFADASGRFQFRPTSAPNVLNNIRDFKFDPGIGVWEAEGGFRVDGGLTVTGTLTQTGAAADFTNAPTVGGTNLVMHKGRGLANQEITLADDTAVAVTLPANCFASHILAITTGNANTAAVLIWVAPVVSVSTIIVQQGGAYETLNGTALTGTTGTDAKVTIGVASQTLYIENRMGATRVFALSFLANR